MRSTRLTAVALVSAVVAGGLALASPAQADPDLGAFRKLVGVGSDTTQDVMNALAGDVVNGKSYAGSAVSAGSVRVASYDAIDPHTGSVTSTVVTRSGGAPFWRPNGSGAGRSALSASLSGNKFNSPNSGSFTIKGQVDFARSSGGPSASGTALTYIPMARDAVGVAVRGAALQNLTVDQLHDIYNGTLDEVDGRPVTPFIPQTGSGTRKFFLAAIGLNDGDLAKTVTTVQENQANDALKADGALVPFSVASWIAQNNGIAPDHSKDAVAAGAYMANIQLPGDTDGTTSPVTKVNGKLAPVAGYYENATFGRDVYNVVPTRAIDPTSVFFDKALYDIFVTSGSHVAALASDKSEDVIDDFGFLNESYNGSISLARHAKQGGLEDGTTAAVPAAPALKAAVSNGSLKLSWTASSTGAAATDYRVLITRADGSVVVNKDLPATTTSYTASGLTAGTYSAKVVANNLVGAGDKPATWTGAVKYSSKTTATVATTAYGHTPKVAVAVVGGGSVKPTGKVTVKEGTTTRGTATLDSHGKATVSLSSHLSVGSHTLTVVYGGNSGLNTSGVTVKLSVTKAASWVAASHPTSVSHTKQAKVSVNVTSSGTTPTGKVQIVDGAKVLATGTLSNGKVTVTLPKLSKGTHKLHAHYLGSSTVNAGNGSTFTIKST
ncbi:Ig-like domain repeat protein [Streptomyces sp. NPDC046977]|uniref:Ig-like domain repeat protein n=1 Tax=Streptomyces sp. NPDC046977 TaxID=3154703 RepID=UPI00340CB52F